MTDAELAAIRERCEAATEGPWEKITERWLGVWQDIRVVAFDGKYTICGDTAIADAEFIAAARTDVPALLDEVERLRDEVADALDLRAGHGPTALEMAMAEVARLRGLLGRAAQESCDHVLGRYAAQTDAKDGDA